MSGAAKLVFVTGKIKREGLSIPFDVPEYEYLVLQKIHGEQDVIETGEHEVDAGERTAATEFARLLTKYSGHADDVREALLSVRSLAKNSGLPYEMGDEAAVQRQAAEERVGSEAKGGAKDAAAKKGRGGAKDDPPPAK